MISLEENVNTMLHVSPQDCYSSVQPFHAAVVYCWMNITRNRTVLEINFCYIAAQGVRNTFLLTQIQHLMKKKKKYIYIYKSKCKKQGDINRSIQICYQTKSLYVLYNVQK